MYVEPNFKTKKALEEAVAAGETVTIFQPGMFGGNEPDNAIVEVVGPHVPPPRPHTWSAQVTVRDGKVIEVQ